MSCNTCGADNAEGASFCATCGAPLEARPAGAPASGSADLDLPTPPARDAPATAHSEAAAPGTHESAVPVGAAAPAHGVCPTCGAANTAGYRFCSNCGTPAPPTDVAVPTTETGPVATESAGAALLRFLVSRGAAAAVIGAAVGIALILIAAVLVRPATASLQNSADLGTITVAQVQVLQSVVDKIDSIPGWAADIHVPAGVIKATYSVSGTSIGGSVEVQAPPTKWGFVALLAIAIAAFVSLLLAKPRTAVEAAVQGALTCVPYAVGVLVIAAIATVPITVDLSSLGLPAPYGAGATLDMVYSYSYVPLALSILIGGSVIGLVVGLLYFSVSSHRRLGVLLSESRIPFAGPVAGTIVALILAMLLTFPATAAIWLHLRSEIPQAALPAVGSPTKYMAAVDDAVLTEWPAAALYAYTFGHGAPLALAFTGSAAGLGAPTGVDGVVRASLLGVSGEVTSLGSLPAGLEYEWWVYALVLLPIIPLVVGGYSSASWSEGGSSPVLEGAKLAVPYTLALVGLAWLSAFAAKGGLSVAGRGAAAFDLTFGPELLFTAVLAFAWAATLGALGGWIRLRRTAT